MLLKEFIYKTLGNFAIPELRFIPKLHLASYKFPAPSALWRGNETLPNMYVSNSSYKAYSH